MSTLKDKLKKLSFFTHYPKNKETLTIDGNTENYPSKKDMWDSWTDIKHNSGVVANNLTVVDQTVLTGTSNAITVSYSRSSSSSKYKFEVKIKVWYPSSHHDNQKANINFVSDTSGYAYSLTNRTITTTQTVYTEGYNSTSSAYPAYVKAGTITVHIPSYFDSTNNIYYTGVSYTCHYTGLSSTIGTSYSVTYL